MAAPPLTITMHPQAVGEIGFEFVSKRLPTVRPTDVVVVVAPTTLNLTRVMLTTPVGPVRLPVWKAEMFVLPLVKEPGLVVGVPANWDCFRPRPTRSSARSGRRLR